MKLLLYFILLEYRASEISSPSCFNKMLVKSVEILRRRLEGIEEKGIEEKKVEISSSPPLGNKSAKDLGNKSAYFLANIFTIYFENRSAKYL